MTILPHVAVPLSFYTKGQKKSLRPYLKNMARLPYLNILSVNLTMRTANDTKQFMPNMKVLLPPLPQVCTLVVN